MSFYVYNVHWDHRAQQSRERSADLLVERIAARAHPSDPVLVTGDFNAGESNPAFRHLIEHGFADSFRAVHPDARQVGTFNDFQGLTDGDKIDAILTSPGWTVIDAAIIRTSADGRLPSDHFPVEAVVQSGGPN